MSDARLPSRREHHHHDDDHRRRTAFTVQRPFVHEGTIADQVFFVAGGAVSLALGVMILVQGAWFGWGWYIAVLLAAWLIIAYLTLPRLHRILSSIYVPNYFIGRARTSDGLLGDPVNVAVVGEESQLHTAMAAAGWTRADDITAQSTWRIVLSTITRRSYDEAPVSPLFLFGRRQDFAYQQEVDGNPGKRHHVRFWRCPSGWLLPGGRRVDWLAAGTYDRAVGFSLFTLQVTHKIDENTDIERDHIVQTVRAAHDDVRVTLIEDFSTGYHSRNGGGDSIVTDGDLPILDVRSLPLDPEFETETDRASGAP
ncbi:MAG: LssY C-terminal domain-containing protein, partial [Pseudoclavibacter sp.]